MVYRKLILVEKTLPSIFSRLIQDFSNLVAMYGKIEGSKSPALTWDKDHVHKLSNTYPHHQTLPWREAHACVLRDSSLRGGNTAASPKVTRDDLERQAEYK